MYGPTETTVWSTCSQRDERRRAASPSAGRSPTRRSGSSTRAASRARSACRARSASAATAWRWATSNRPELTAERFVPDPFASAGAGARAATAPATAAAGAPTACSSTWAASTSRSRCAATASSWARSRRSLATQPQVARAVVVAREDRPGDVRLVAYVVRAPARALDDARAARAPEAARCPTTWCRSTSSSLDALPLLPNGKIDRKALPAPDMAVKRGRRARGAAQRAGAHRSPTAMAQVLGLAGRRRGRRLLRARRPLAAGRAADRAPQPGARHRAAAAHAVRGPTVATPGALVQGIDGEAAPQRASRSRRGPISTRGPLSLMQERLWLLEELNPGRVTYNAPSAHRLSGPLDVAAFERAFARWCSASPCCARRSARRRRAGADRARHASMSTSRRGGRRATCPPAEREAEVSRRMDALIADAVRPRPRAAVPRRACSGSAGRARVVLHAAPHRSGTAGRSTCCTPRWPSSTPRCREGRAPNAAGTAGVLRRLRGLAPRMAAGPGVRRAARLLARAPRRTARAGVRSRCRPTCRVAPACPARGVTHRIVVSNDVAERAARHREQVDATLYMVLLTRVLRADRRTLRACASWSSARRCAAATPPRSRT